MFFILSKILIFLIRPINWVFGLLILALLSKKDRQRKRLLWYALGLFFIFSNGFLSNLMYHWWEANPEYNWEKEKPYEVGILLGGYTDLTIVPADDRQNFSPYANRFVNALEIYRKGYFKNWLLTGGSGKLLGEEKNEAEEMKQFLIRLGVPDSVIWIENQSRNTRENALFTQKYLSEKAAEARCLLITSAWHMPRAKACFDKVGLSTTAYYADYNSKQIVWTPDAWLFPSAAALDDWNFLIKEWVGYIVYWLKGYL